VGVFLLGGGGLGLVGGFWGGLGGGGSDCGKGEKRWGRDNRPAIESSRLVEKPGDRTWLGAPQMVWGVFWGGLRGWICVESSEAKVPELGGRGWGV